MFDCFKCSAAYYTVSASRKMIITMNHGQRPLPGALRPPTGLSGSAKVLFSSLALRRPCLTAETVPSVKLDQFQRVQKNLTLFDITVLCVLARLCPGDRLWQARQLFCRCSLALLHFLCCWPLHRAICQPQITSTKQWQQQQRCAGRHRRPAVSKQTPQTTVVSIGGCAKFSPGLAGVYALLFRCGSGSNKAASCSQRLCLISQHQNAKPIILIILMM